MESRIIRVFEDDAGQRLDCFLASSLCELSRSKIQSMIKKDDILVNNKTQKPSYCIEYSDKIEIKYNPKDSLEILPQDISLDIRYEDENMLVVNKPFEMLTHPTVNEIENTLVNALLFYTKGQLSDLNGYMRPGIVHRLDRNTSGLLLIAKNNKAHEFLAEQIKTKKAKRKYVAIVSGDMPSNEGVLEFEMGRHPTKPEKMAVVKEGKFSRTYYKVLERFKGYSFLELQLDTGRTHQIRVHLSHINHPIVNDTLYGGEKLKVKTTEQVLQAFSLTFLPMNKKDDIIIQIDLDSDVNKVLNYLRSKK